MTPADPDPNGSLSVERFESHLASLLDEMRDDYYHAMRKSIVDYVLTNVNERERLGLEFVRFKRLEAAATRGLDALGTTSRDVARRRRRRARGHRVDAADALPADDAPVEPVARGVCERQAGEWRSAASVQLDSSDEKVSQPWELDAFVAHQRATREATKTALWERWTADTAEVFRDDPPVCVACRFRPNAYYAAVSGAVEPASRARRS